jgi:uncharacterized protein (TIGR02231 family)
MRSHLLALSLLAVPASLWADEFSVPSRVTEATVFPQGAMLKRMATFDVPEGRHQIILTDMPRIDPESLRLTAPGLTVGAVRYRDDFVPPRNEQQTAAYEAAEALVREKERAVEVAWDAVDSIQIEADTAKARIAFLDGIGQSDGLAQVTTDKLRELAQMIGEEGLTARRAVQAAETRVREAQRAAKEVEEELAKAKQALKALSTANKDRAYLAIDVTSDGGAKGAMVLNYAVWNANWTPTYDVRLTTQGTESLVMENGAYVQQSTGEDWTGVDLTLSTVRPSGQGQPGEVWPLLRRFFDPQRPEPMQLTRSLGKAADAAVAEPVMAEETTATSDFDGLSVTYRYPDPVNIANEADAVKISLGTLEFEPEVFARAVPLTDPTAFLAAEFRNDSGEMILGGGTAQFYLDGTYVGQRYLDLIASGDTEELSFGPIDGLRLDRVVKDRQEGDRGVITRQNEQNETVEITLRNLTPRNWDVRLRDRVPYSEQEDLEISWDAQPVPTQTNVEDRRGVLEWRFDMAPGADQRVVLNHRIRWPDGKVLR